MLKKFKMYAWSYTVLKTYFRWYPCLAKIARYSAEKERKCQLLLKCSQIFFNLCTFIYLHCFDQTPSLYTMIKMSPNNFILISKIIQWLIGKGKTSTLASLSTNSMICDFVHNVEKSYGKNVLDSNSSSSIYQLFNFEQVFWLLSMGSC